MTFSAILPFLVLGSILLAAALAPLVRVLALQAKAVDAPTGGRKIHKVTTALWGGLATGGAIVAMLGIALPYVDGKELRSEQVLGFALALLILMAGGMLDDRYDLPPATQFLFPLVASIIVVLSGSGIVQVTNPFGPGAISLVWWKQTFWLFTVSLPSDLMTIVWLLTVTYAMKFLDGLDGLATGMTIIGGMLIAVLAGSSAYFQPFIAFLALCIAGAHLGFLPFNRQGWIFLGEAGSTIAGFSLAVLAVISGAKVATAATALAIPLVDIALVIGRRLMRGQSPFKGDSSHFHFQLLKAGLSPRMAVRLIWGIALTFGLLALTLQTKGKLFLFAGLTVLILVISILVWKKAERRS